MLSRLSPCFSHLPHVDSPDRQPMAEIIASKIFRAFRLDISSSADKDTFLCALAVGVEAVAGQLVAREVLGRLLRLALLAHLGLHANHHLRAEQ